MATRAFGDVVRAARTDGRLVVQPRMGFGDPRRMRHGLAAVKDASAATVGTITVDSYTRLAQHTEARAALDAGRALNGYPIVAHDRQTTRRLLQRHRHRRLPGAGSPRIGPPPGHRPGPRRRRVDSDRGRTGVLLPPLRPDSGPHLGRQLGRGLRAAGRPAPAAARAAPGDVRGLPAGSAVPTEPAGGDQRPGGALLHTAGHPEHLAQLRPADQRAAGRGGRACARPAGRRAARRHRLAHRHLRLHGPVPPDPARCLSAGGRRGATGRAHRSRPADREDHRRGDPHPHRRRERRGPGARCRRRRAGVPAAVPDLRHRDLSGGAGPGRGRPRAGRRRRPGPRAGAEPGPAGRALLPAPRQRRPDRITAGRRRMAALVPDRCHADLGRRGRPPAGSARATSSPPCPTSNDATTPAGSARLPHPPPRSGEPRDPEPRPRPRCRRAGPRSPPALGQHLADPVTRAALRIQDIVVDAARRHLRERGFVELLPRPSDR